MAEATNQQVQSYADTRIRVRAEQARTLVAAIRDDKAAVDDVYARATGVSRWNDARTDGPPHLLQCGGGVNPDDVLNYNAVITALLGILDAANGTNDAANAATLRGAWAVFQRACVRPVSTT